MAFELFIGKRYLRTKGQTFIFLVTFLSVTGVAVGVTALIVVIAVMAGFESDLKSRILGIEAHIVLKRQGPFSGYEPVLERVAAVEGVRAAAPYIDGQTMIRSAGRATGAIVRGIDPASAGDVYGQLNAGWLQRPRPNPREGPTGPPGIILGSALAKSLGVMKSDVVHVISPRGTLSPIGHLPGMRQFEVVGTFTTGVYAYDESLAFIDLAAAQSFFRMGDAVTGIVTQVDHVYQARKIANRILAMLGSSYQADDWMMRNKNLFAALKIEKAAMFIILALIILVAAFNISGSLIMMVMEKTKDISILKAMGATGRSIKKIFVFKGMIIGTIGVGSGTLLGTGLCLALRHYKFVELPDDVYYITTLPVQLAFSDVCIIGISALIICFLATIYPARRASKLNPIEAIRYG